MGLGAPRHVGSSWTKDQTHVPCIGRRILNHCATREVPCRTLLNKNGALPVCPLLQVCNYTAECGWRKTPTRLPGLTGNSPAPSSRKSLLESNNISLSTLSYFPRQWITPSPPLPSLPSLTPIPPSFFSTDDLQLLLY